MIKRNLLLNILLIALSSTMIMSCQDDENDDLILVPPDNRIFITNEGPFQNGSGSLTIYKRGTDEITNNAFEQVNGFPLGNLVQSVAVHEDKVYIVINNANKIEIADKDDLISLGRIDDISLPRYFMGISKDKAYVSSWDNKVYVLDLNTNTISGSIPTGTGPEKMLLSGEEVWVLNQGGFSIDSTITVISTTNDEIVQTIQVGDKPTGIVRDNQGLIWVMCSGNGWNGFPGQDDTKGKLICIDPQDYEIVKTIEFPASDSHPEKLIIDNNGQTVYFNYPGGLYSQDLNKVSLELNIVLASQTMFYGLGYDPKTGNVFATDPLDYTQNGKVYIINPVGEEILKSFDAGVIPGEMSFN